MLYFDFLEKVLGLVFPPHFVHDFARKMILMLYSLNWPQFIARLPLLLEILSNICIAIVCFLGFDVIHFGINFIFLILSLYMIETPRENFKYLVNEKSFQG